MKSSFHASPPEAIRRAALAMLVVLIRPAAAQSTHEGCVDVRVGTSQSYDCINQQLGAIAREAHQSLPTPTQDAGKVPANQTGQFNESATRNRLGANFGKSVIPYRPGANVPTGRPQ